jgi:hypothetical protein
VYNRAGLRTHLEQTHCTAGGQDERLDGLADKRGFHIHVWHLDPAIGVPIVSCCLLRNVPLQVPCNLGLLLLVADARACILLCAAKSLPCNYDKLAPLPLLPRGTKAGRGGELPPLCRCH